MRKGRCRFTQPILIKAEPGLRAAAADVARREGLSLSELIRRDLRALVAAQTASAEHSRKAA
jgi:hypothetical protein